MKFYLSSYRLGNFSNKLVEYIGTNKKIAVIRNAKDGSTDQQEVQKSLQREVDDLKQLGLLPSILDLREYFKNKDGLKKELKKYGAVWVVGGNTFILRKAMFYSGFDTYIKEKVTDENFVYAGYSAGICVLAAKLQGIDLCDEPDLTPAGYKKEIIWEGLGIIPYSIAPHYRSDHPESAMMENVVKFFHVHNIPYKTLRDGEVILSDMT